MSLQVGFGFGKRQHGDGLREEWANAVMRIVYMQMAASRHVDAKAIGASTAIAMACEAPDLSRCEWRRHWPCGWPFPRCSKEEARA